MKKIAKSILITCFSLVIVLCLTFTSSPTVHALTIDAGSTPGSGGGENIKNGIAIDSSGNQCVGYRVSVIQSNGNTKGGVKLDILKNSSSYNIDRYGYPYHAVGQKNKYEYIKTLNTDSFNTTTSTSGYNSTTFSALGLSWTDPEGIESYLQSGSALNTILYHMGFTNIASLSSGDKVIIEPLWSIRLGSGTTWHFLTITEMGVFGRYEYGESTYGSGQWLNVVEYTNKIFPNRLYTPDGSSLWEGTAALESYAWFSELIYEGYGAAIAYDNTPQYHTLTINYYSNYATSAFSGALNTVGADKNVLVRTWQMKSTYNETDNLHDYTKSSDATYLGRAGYTATGYWGTSPTGGTKVHQSTDFSSATAIAAAFGYNLNTSDVTLNLYAQWEENTLTVNYYSNYATSAFSGALNTVGADKNVLVRTWTIGTSYKTTDSLHNYASSGDGTYLARTGYTATGYWGTSTSGGTTLHQGIEFSSATELAAKFGKDLNAGDVVLNLYAQWTENYLTVNYYSNYADNSASGLLNTVGADKNVLVKTYTFNYDDEYYYGLEDYTFTDSVTYLARNGYSPTAHWGTTTSGGYLVHQNTSFATGQALAEALGKSIINGNATVNVYPQWTENYITVNYYSNYADQSASGLLNTVGADKNVLVATANYYYDDSYATYGLNDYTFTTSATYLARTGYTPTAYWGTSPNGGYRVHQNTGFDTGQALAEALGKSIRNGNVTVNVYAQWKDAKYLNSLSHWIFGLTQGEGNNWNNTAYNISYSPFSQSYAAGETFVLDASAAPEIPNGFYLRDRFGTANITGSWDSYPMGTTVTQVANEMSFEFDYYPNSYTITYDVGNGTNNSSNPSTYNVLYGVTFEDPTPPTGYIFNGWYLNGTKITGINEGVTNNFTSPSDVYDRLATRTTGNITVKAGYTPITYTDTVTHWLLGLTNNEGNNSALNAYSLGVVPFSQDYAIGNTFILDESKALEVPNGFSLQDSFGTYNITGSWGDYAMGTTVTQVERAMNFEYYYNPNDYTITYDVGNGTNNASNPSTYNVLYGVTFEDPIPPTGYIFNGWYWDGTEVTGINVGVVNNFISPSDAYDKLATRTTGNITVKAGYTPITYTVKYNANGGTAKTESSTHTYDVAKALTTNGFSRAGHTFAGWTSNADGTGTKYTDKQSVKNLSSTNGATVNLYAQWTPVSYTITYDLAGGALPSGKTNPTSYTIDTATFTLNNPTRTGYTFKGWTGSNGTTAQTSVSVEKGSTGNKSYTAKWEANTNTAYKVQHWQQKVGGGTTENSTNFTLVSADTQNLTGTTGASVTPAVKTYTGFKSPSTKTVTIAGDGSTVVNYYYTRNSYAVTINKGTGISAVSGAGTYQYGATVSIDATVSTGYTWNGWTVDAGDITTPDAKADTFTMPAKAVTLTANAIAGGYSITYDLQGGALPSGKTNPASYTVNTATFTLNNPTRTGYTFKGWTGSNGTTPQTTVTIAKGSTGNKSYTAKWEINSYAVTINKGTGISSVTGAGTYDYGATVSIDATVAAGYTWSGWTVNAGGITTPDTKADTFTMPAAAVTLTANAKANTNTAYKVQHWQQKVGGGTTENSTNFTLVSADTQNLTGTTGASVTPAVKTYTGFKSPSTKTVTIAGDGSTVVNYYYTRNSYAVTINKGTGISSVSGAGTYQYGATVSIDATLSTGYTWNGWTVDAGGITTPDTKADSFTMPAKAVTLTANAIAGGYSITYDLKGGALPSGKTNPASYTVNTATFTLNNPTRTGYTFKGWTGSNGTTPQTTVQIAKGSTGNKSYTANWDAANVAYTVEHWQEKIGVSGTDYTNHYTNVETQNLTAKADSKVTPAVKTYTGFTSPTPQEVTVKPDGTTVVKYYYKRDSYAVTINKGTGISTVSGAGTYDYGATVSIDATVSSGYAWNGWTVNAGGITAPDTKADTFTMPAKAVTLTANAKSNAFTIEYNANGGTGTMSSHSVTYGSSVKIKDNEFTAPKGHKFVGWTTKSDGSNDGYGWSTSTGAGWSGTWSYSNGQYGIANNTLKLYAQWSPITYTVKYNENGGTGTMESSTHTYGVAKALNENKFTRTGYTFAGWNTNSNGTGTKYTDKQSVTNLSSTDGATVNLYAQWTPLAFTITYNANGGTGTMSSHSVNYGSSVKIKDNEFTAPKGHKFVGWTTKSDGTADGHGWSTATGAGWSGTWNYTNGQYGIVNNTLALYARWEPKTFTIEYNANGGTGTMDSHSVTYGSSVKIKDNTFTRTGYKFVGWTTKSDGTDDGHGWSTGTGAGWSGTWGYDNGQYGIANDKLLLYARWTPDTGTAYKVQHWQQKVGGGSTQNSTNFMLKDTDNLTGTTGASVTPAVKTYTGFTSPTPQKVTIKADGTTVVNYYYTRNSYAVTINKGTGISSVSGAGTYQYGASVSIDATVSTGYTWSGWTVNAGDITTPDTKADSFTMPAKAVTLTANAKGNTIKVTLDNQGATTAGTPAYWYQYKTTKVINGETVYYYTDSACTTPLSGYTITKPTKTGYTFGGYFTGKNGTGTQYVNAAGMCINNLYSAVSSDITLYAKWTPITYTVAYNPNGGTGTTASSSHTYDVAKALTANGFSRTGYTFAGWTTKSDGTGTKYTDKQSVTNLTSTDGATVNLYAQWTPVTYTITYDLAGGALPSGKTNPTSYTIETATFTLNNPTRTGYTFKGWTGSNGTTASTSVSIAKGSTGNKSYTAKWEINSYAVTINKGTGISSVSGAGTYDYGATVSIDATVSTGYKWSGWTVTAGGITTPDTKADSFTMPAKAVTLTANATPITYTVAYNGNGGTGTTTSSSHTYNVAKALTANGFSRTGYTFAGWTTNANGTGTKYTDKQSVTNLSSTDGATVNLYAQWTPVTYTITYNLAGGALPSGKTNPTSYTIETATFTLNNPTRTGYTFKGWTGSNGTTPQTTVQIAKGSTGNKSYTAKWEANDVPYVVEHWQEKIGVSGTDYTNHYTKVETQNLTAKADSKVTPAVKTYTGFTSPTPQEVTVKPDGTLVVKYYYKRDSYAVTINKGTGISSVSGAGTYDYGATVSIDATVAAGYSWNGWTVNAGGITTPDAKADSFTMPAKAVTLTANAKVITYTITYDLAGGTLPSGKTNPTSYTVETATFTLNNPTRVGYTFKGWTGSNGTTPQTTVQIAKGSTGNKSYTAKWEATDVPYVVEHWQEKIGVSGTDYTNHYTKVETQNLIAKADSKVTPAVKTYTGFTSPTPQEVTVKPDGTLVVKYYYKRNSYDVTIYMGTGISSVSGAGTYDYGATVYINATVSSDYTWNSWIVNAGGITRPNTKSDRFMMPANAVTLTATANSPGTDPKDPTTWTEWEYEEDELRVFTYKVAPDGMVLKITPDTTNPAINSGGDPVMRSGYAFSAEQRTGWKNVEGYDEAESNMVTGFQTVSAHFPEFRTEADLTASGVNKYRWMEDSDKDGIFDLPVNTVDADGENERLHFTPVWYPDGEYRTWSHAYDCWTPAGMISATTESNAILIDGNLYDDWYIGRYSD